MPLPTITGHALNTGRVAWYLALDAAGTGTTWPDLVAGRDATVAAPDWRSTTQPGGLGRLVYPRATIPAAAMASAPMAAISGAAWVHCDGLAPAHSSILASPGLFVETHTDARILMIANNGGAPFFLVTSGPSPGGFLPADAWSRVAWTFDGSTLKCFFNGALAGSLAITGGALDAPASQAYLGQNDGSGSQPWPGSMNDVATWSRALSDAEVADEYAQASTGHPDLLDFPPPATTYTFGGPSGGAAGAASTDFALAPDGAYTGTITVTPSGGGLSTPIVKTWAASSAPQAFTLTPTSAGTVTLTPTNSGGLADPSARTYVASDAGGSGGVGMTPEEVQAAVVAGIDDWIALHARMPADVTRVDPAVLPLDANLVEMLGAAVDPDVGPLDARLVEVDPAVLPLDADLVKVKGADFAVEELLARILVAGTVADATPSASSVHLSSNTSATSNFYVGSVLAFSGGALKGLARRITAYGGSTRAASFAAPFPQAPANGDPFLIFGRIDG